jgi:hypothetical protein
LRFHPDKCKVLSIIGLNPYTSLVAYSIWTQFVD